VVVGVGWAELGVVVAVGIDIGQGGVVDPRGQLLLVGDLEQAQVVDAGRWWGPVSGCSGRALGWA
jgi:hypothetical protein